MFGPRRCFATVKAVRHLDARLLCEVLRKFPNYLRVQKLVLPAHPREDNLDYETIQTACMSGDMPKELDDVLSHVSMLGTTEGWARIQEEARAQGNSLEFPMDGLTNADLR